MTKGGKRWTRHGSAERYKMVWTIGITGIALVVGTVAALPVLWRWDGYLIGGALLVWTMMAGREHHRRARTAGKGAWQALVAVSPWGVFAGALMIMNGARELESSAGWATMAAVGLTIAASGLALPAAVVSIRLGMRTVDEVEGRKGVKGA